MRPARLFSGAPAVLGALCLCAVSLPAAAQPRPDMVSPQEPDKKAEAPKPRKPKPAKKGATGSASTSEDSGVMRYPPSSVRLPLILGGTAVTGTAYGLSVMSARIWQDVPGADALLIPIAGPWISLAQNECSESNPDCGALLYIRGALLVLDGIAQLAGLGLIGEGIFMTTEADSATPAKPDKSKPKPKPKSASWKVAPVIGPTQAGVGLVGTF